MNLFEKFSLAVVTIVTLSLVVSGGGPAYRYYIEQVSGAMLPIAAAGWVIATYGPTALAVGFWRWAKRIRAPWVLHLLFFPCAAGVFRTGDALMLSVIEGPDFDATLGGPEIAAMLLLAVAIGGYFFALIAGQISKIGGPASGS